MKSALGSAGALLAATLACSLGAQSTFTGCATPLKDDPTFLVLREKDSCALLRGNVDLKWSGHTITLRGKLHLSDGVQPRTIVVESVEKLSGQCEQTCEPSLNGRGVDKPGSKEAGTPGVVAPKPKSPQ